VYCRMILTLMKLLIVSAALLMPLGGIADASTAALYSVPPSDPDLLKSLARSFLDLQDMILEESNIHRENFMKLMKDTSEWLASTRIYGALTGQEPSTAPYSLKDIIANGKQYLELSEVDHAWDVMGEEEGVKIWKLKKNAMKFGTSDDKSWPCIKSSTIIDADPKKVLALLMDSSKVKKYNQYSIGRDDIERVSKNTKIVWNKTRIPFSVKPFDYCTLMHHYEVPRRRADGSKTKDIIIISKFVEHELVPVHKNFARCENIIGLQILRSLHSSKNHKPRTEITSISHVRYPSTHPILISANAFRGTFNYLDQLRDILSN
jgi:hypothetical protein